MTDEKVRENRARRAAERQGLGLVKSRRRDPKALDYDMYGLTELSTGEALKGVGAPSLRYGLTIDEVEVYLYDSPAAERVVELVDQVREAYGWVETHEVEIHYLLERVLKAEGREFSSDNIVELLKDARDAAKAYVPPKAR